MQSFIYLGEIEVSQLGHWATPDFVIPDCAQE